MAQEVKPLVMDQITALKFAAGLLNTLSDSPGDDGIYALYGKLALEQTIRQSEPEYLADYMSDEMWEMYIGQNYDCYTDDEDDDEESI